MFTIFRYGLLPVVLFCGVIVAASIDTFATNAAQDSSWGNTTATVIESKDFGDTYAKFSGKPNTFPDPQGTLRYVVAGKTYTWSGRGRDIGLIIMARGDKIPLRYNPENPQEIGTLVLLGAGTGSIILSVALAFLAFYFWFFWLRGFFGRSGPGDSDGDAVDPGLERFERQVERSHFVPAAEPNRPTFGKR
jgi:hypothetical protein